MNYQQTIDYLYNTLPMFSRIGSAAFKKDLHNTRALCEHLGNPHTKFKTIHVGGTNGKGSCSHMLSAVFQAAGLKTGLYTSPHLYDFRERIRVNGIMCEEEFVVDFTGRMKNLIEMIQPSFFEITVAMAFEYFALQQVDIAVIEVGLGGRLDSTNIIDPEISIITNIGWDHMNLLGNTLEDIAKEKAGIIKNKRPVVIGERQKETTEIFSNVAKENGAPLYFAEDLFEVKAYRWTDEGLCMDILETESGRMHTFQTDLPGIYQVKNVRTVLSALKVLQDYNRLLQTEHGVVERALRQVINLTGLKGRWEVVHKAPTVILEVAHNKDGINQVLLHLQKMKYNRLHMVFGMVKDKDAAGVLQMLPRDCHYYFTQAQIPRALNAEMLAEKAKGYELEGTSYKDVNSALRAAISNADPDDLVIVCGSIFLIAEVDRNLHV